MRMFALSEVHRIGMGRRRVVSKPSRGFTLVELLIGISLVGLILSLAFGGMRIATRSWDTMELAIGETGELRLVHDFVRRQFAQTRPVSRTEPGADAQERRFAFQGHPSKVAFVAPLPAQQRVIGSLYLFTLQIVEGEQDDMRLAISYEPYFPEPVFGENEDNTVVLADGIEAGEFAYFGADKPDEEAAWHDRWEDRTALPQLVRLRIKMAKGRSDWPDLVVALRSGIGV